MNSGSDPRPIRVPVFVEMVVRVHAPRGLFVEVVMRTIDEVLNRIRAEFLEMPGMRLRQEQVQRLCGLDSGLCRAVLDSLVRSRFLSVSADGQYARATDRS